MDEGALICVVDDGLQDGVTVGKLLGEADVYGDVHPDELPSEVGERVAAYEVQEERLVPGVSGAEGVITYEITYEGQECYDHLDDDGGLSRA